MAKQKKSKATDVDSDNIVNEEVEVEVEVKDSESTDDIGTLSYEELLDKKEELEKSILRANADLDNALKRTLSEV